MDTMVSLEALEIYLIKLIGKPVVVVLATSPNEALDILDSASGRTVRQNLITIDRVKRLRLKPVGDEWQSISSPSS